MIDMLTYYEFFGMLAAIIIIILIIDRLFKNHDLDTIRLIDGFIDMIVNESDILDKIDNVNFISPKFTKSVILDIIRKHIHDSDYEVWQKDTLLDEVEYIYDMIQIKKRL